MTDEALSDYEVMRRRRIEKNQQVLASLAVPNLPRVSSRSQAPKAAVKLEPTRRSSRQRTQRETFEQHEIGGPQQKVQSVTPPPQESAFLDQLLRQHYEKTGSECVPKTQKIKDRKFERFKKSNQRKLESSVVARKQQQVRETRKRQVERQKQYEMPPEKVAKRNAKIQQFIQEELNKQAWLAREQKQWELEHQRLIHEQLLTQDEVHRQIATTGLVEANNTVGITNEDAELALMETVMGEAEYELVL